MLRDKAGAEQFDALASDLFYDRRVVQKPPTPEGHQIIELASIDTQFVLILAAQYADQESVVGKIAAQILQGPQIRASYCVACQAKARIYLLAHSNHQGKRNVQFA